jgi:low temperature requirement protein LtrA
MVTMSGALTMAAGIDSLFKSLDLTMVVIGFIIMRLAMVALWLRAAAWDAERRRTAFWYAGGITLVQVYWTLLLVFKPSGALTLPLYSLGVAMELAVPVLAERHGETPWHRHHIIERYGLLNIIVLGETLLAGSMALAEAANHHFDIRLVHIAMSAMVILFCLWWLYFSKEEHLAGNRLGSALVWGYGHVLIYLSGAATGAGFAVLVDIVTGHSTLPLITGDYAVAIPVALYMAGLWFVRDRNVLQGKGHLVLPAFAVLVLVAPQVLGLEGIALVCAVSVWARSLVGCRVHP